MSDTHRLRLADMTKQHCYTCKALYMHIWTICFEVYFDEDTFYKIEVVHEKQQDSFSNTFFKVQLYMTCKSLFFIVKQPSDHELLQTYNKEQKFYSILSPHLGTVSHYVPKCYLLDSNLARKPCLFTVMEDLTAQGYRVSKRKLDERHLLLCIKSLAHFHRRMFNLEMNKHGQYRSFCNEIKMQQLKDYKEKQLNKIKFLKSSSIIRDKLNIYLRARLILKLNSMISETTRNMRTAFSTIIHGRFVRSKLMFKYMNNKPCEVKIVGWHAVTFGSVATDFGRIVLSNLPVHKDVTQLVGFFCKILMAYVESAQLHPEKRSSLRKEIINRLMYSYVDFFWTMENHIKLLEVFDQLGALN